MGILTKKYQQGGAVNYGDFKNLNMGGFDFTGLLKINENNGNGARPSTRRRSGTSTLAKNKAGALQSDLLYYDSKKEELNDQIKAGLDANPDGFDESAKYKELTQELYKLENDAVQMKSMAKLFSTSKTNFLKRAAGDAPAIIGNNAIVYDYGKQKYSTVSNENLIKNSNKYKLLNASDVLTLRQVNPEFSGFTDLGKLSVQIIDNAYGQDSFDKFLKLRIKSAGYVKKNGKLINSKTENIIDLGNVDFDDGGNLINTNSLQLDNLVQDIISNEGSNAGNYLEKVAIKDLYNESKRKESNLKELTDSDIHTEIYATKVANLIGQMKSSIVFDEKPGSEGGPQTIDNLTIEQKRSKVSANAAKVAIVTMFKDSHHIEVDSGIDKKSKAGSILYKVPASPVAIVNGKSILDNGWEDTPVEEKYLSNNPTIRAIKSPTGVVTTADGTNILKMTEDEYEKFVTIDPKSNLYFLIAPIETSTDEGEYVNFESEHAKKIADVITKLYAKLNDAGITQDDISSGKDKDKLLEALQIAEADLREADASIPTNIRFGIAAAFDVLLQAKNAYEDYKYSSPVTDEQETFMNSVEENHWFNDNPIKVKGFIPIGQGFWDAMYADNLFGKDFKLDYTLIDWLNLLNKKTSPMVSSQFYGEGLMKSEAQKIHSKKTGGKLLSPEDMNKLFLTR